MTVQRLVPFEPKPDEDLELRGFLVARLGPCPVCPLRPLRPLRPGSVTAPMLCCAARVAASAGNQGTRAR